MNAKKTKTMYLNRDEKERNINVNITVNGTVLEQVNKFKYLGQWITADGRSELEVKTRIEIARRVFIKMKDVFASRHFSLDLKKRMIKCYVWSTLLYGCETWTLTVELEHKINAFEMWMYRRIFRISYMDRITNEEVLRRANTKRTLLNLIRTRKLKYCGHLIRANQLQRQLLDGKCEGKRSMDAWRSMVAHVCS